MSEYPESYAEPVGPDTSWKSRALLIGAVAGAIVGIGTAYLFTRTVEEAGQTPPTIGTGDAIRAAVGIIGTMRGIASLGNP